MLLCIAVGQTRGEDGHPCRAKAGFLVTLQRDRPNSTRYRAKADVEDAVFGIAACRATGVENVGRCTAQCDPVAMGVWIHCHGDGWYSVHATIPKANDYVLTVWRHPPPPELARDRSELTPV